ncbi:uncharacterized protein LOC120842370 [Ixodes scapularis]|uniref:uncharacterized protein LOC120842370 n=1 Tax=Ixodes scapularis TaxID=6945 RepID=UPI001C383725|nr:uncharacterized protein LOC120842370 [Ixodes scapularis]
MYPTLLVVASLVAAITSVGSEKTSPNGSPVDAWRVVTLKDAFFLIYRSYEIDEGFGDTGKCASIQLSEANETARTTKTKIMYRDPQTTEMTEYTVSITVPRSDGSTVCDTVQISDETCKPEFLTLFKI